MAGLAASPSLAGEKPVVLVELFTSQGCSSCPPADALMMRLTGRDDVIPLALHVDYWDYIGWKDQFADPAYTKRQKAYAHVGGRRMIYTPQMVVNGQEDLVGAKGMELAELIAAHRAIVPRVRVVTQRDGDRLSVRVEPLAAPLKGPFNVHLVRYAPLRTVEITKGENAGRRLDYANVVENWTVIGEWDGTGPAELSAEVTGPAPAVVLIQAKGPGAIVAAARAE